MIIVHQDEALGLEVRLADKHIVLSVGEVEVELRRDHALELGRALISAALDQRMRKTDAGSLKAGFDSASAAPST